MGGYRISGGRPRNAAQKFESRGSPEVINHRSRQRRKTSQTDRQTDGNVMVSFFGATRTTTVIRMGRLFRYFTVTHAMSDAYNALGVYQQFCGRLFKNDIYVRRIPKDRHV